MVDFGWFAVVQEVQVGYGLANSWRWKRCRRRKKKRREEGEESQIAREVERVRV